MKPLEFLIIISTNQRNTILYFPSHGWVGHFTCVRPLKKAFSLSDCAPSWFHCYIVLFLFSSPLFSEILLTKEGSFHFYPFCSARPFPLPSFTLSFRLRPDFTAFFDKHGCGYVYITPMSTTTLFCSSESCTVFKMFLLHMASLNCQCSHRTLCALQPVLSSSSHCFD